jgi:hypothetical protein
MTSFLNFHAFAAARGDGLRPELRALFERGAAPPRLELTVRNDGMVQSGPDPISAEVAPERGNMSPFPQTSARQTHEANHRLGLFEKKRYDAHSTSRWFFDSLSLCWMFIPLQGLSDLAQVP